MLKLLNPLYLLQNYFTLPWVGGAISAGASLLGGALGSDAVEGASGFSAEQIQQAMDEMKALNQRTRQDTNPYRNLGAGAAGKLQYLLGIGSNSNTPYSGMNLIEYNQDGTIAPNAQLYATDPAYAAAFNKAKNKYTNNTGFADNVKNVNGYGERAILNSLDNGTPSSQPTGSGGFGALLKGFDQEALNNDLVYQNGLKFGLDQGVRSLENRARASGGTDSGAVYKALARYANDYGTTKTEGAYNRFNQDKSNTYNMLTGSMNTGMSAVNTDANAANALGTNMAGLYGAQASNNAAGALGQANAWGNAIGGAANAIGGMDWEKILKGGGSTVGGTSIPIKF